jgi:acyl-coenzyme A thioesterase PaaI-like protein
MVTTILDSAMGGACWSVLSEDEVFLTADLRVEFYRSARPGLLTARGSVIKRTSRLAFCAAGRPLRAGGGHLHFGGRQV